MLRGLWAGPREDLSRPERFLEVWAGPGTGRQFEGEKVFAGEGVTGSGEAQARPRCAVWAGGGWGPAGQGFHIDTARARRGYDGLRVWGGPEPIAFI